MGLKLYSHPEAVPDLSQIFKELNPTRSVQINPDQSLNCNEKMEIGSLQNSKVIETTTILLSCQRDSFSEKK
jgi:hypothetical protein